MKILSLLAGASCIVLFLVFAFRDDSAPVKPSIFLEPPAEYNKPYPGGTTVKFFPRSEMWRRCSILAGKYLKRQPAECGVARRRKDLKKHCFVYINEVFRGTENEDLLMRHGRAHCHGWKHPLQRPGQR